MGVGGRVGGVWCDLLPVVAPVTWEVGDLAVRVEGSPGGLPGAPPIGQIVRVDGVGISKSSGRVGLRFDGYPNHNPYSVGWTASHFRKIRPDEHESCEPEFVQLLTRIRHKWVKEHVAPLNDFYRGESA